MPQLSNSISLVLMVYGKILSVSEQENTQRHKTSKRIPAEIVDKLPGFM